MRAALLLVLLAGGCGFERATPFAGARIPDVGPWSDAGPLTLCDGAAHIVAPSLGGVQTLLTRPATTSHAGLSREERLNAGISDGLIRMSVGIEDTDELIEDLVSALRTL